MDRKYTLTLEVPSKIARALDGANCEGLDSICGINNSYCALQIIKTQNSICNTANIELTGDIWGLKNSFGFLVSRVKMAEAQIALEDNNVARISHLQSKIESITEKFDNQIKRLESDRRRLCLKYNEVAIPVTNDSESESEMESTGFGLISTCGKKKIQKAIDRRQSKQKSGISRQSMKTMVQIFITGVQLVPREISISFEEFRAAFLLFLKRKNQSWEKLRPTSGFSQSLLHHVRAQYKDLVYMKEGRTRICVSISFPK